MVCDFWVCKNKAHCTNAFSGNKYPPCAVCPHFDKCDVCANYIECCNLVVRYLPDMFRRLVKEIRIGEDTTVTEQKIRKNTLGGRKRG